MGTRRNGAGFEPVSMRIRGWLPQQPPIDHRRPWLSIAAA
jgi:hypothetical protein